MSVAPGSVIYWDDSQAKVIGVADITAEQGTILKIDLLVNDPAKTAQLLDQLRRAIARTAPTKCTVRGRAS